MRFNIVASDKVIVSGRQAYTYVVLDQWPSPVVLGMPFLANTNPAIDWYTESAIFGD